MGFTLDSTKVEGNLFADRGKWKYTVVLDYHPGEGTYGAVSAVYDDWNLWAQARNALRRATDHGISGVTLREIPEGWTLVVLEPYSRYSHPIMVRR